MSQVAISDDEAQRLAALRRYAILDTPEETQFDDFTWLASQVCEVPVSLITLLDADRQWFKSKVGTAISETPRELSFCNQTIKGTEVLEVPDTTKDARFSDNVLVKGEPRIRFYAGMPLTTSDGYGLGSLCVLDIVPRELTSKQRESLSRLGRQVMAQLELRVARLELKNQLQSLTKARETKSFLSAIVESSVDAIIGMNLERIVTSWNNGAERIFGYCASEMLGRSADILIPQDLLEHRNVLLERISKGERVEHFDTARIAKDGSRIQMSISISPIRNERDELIAFSVVGRDITEQKRHEQELEKLVAELRDASLEIKTLSRMLPMCAWCHKVRDDKGYWDDVEIFFSKRQGIKWSHGICPSCSKNMKHSLEPSEPLKN